MEGAAKAAAGGAVPGEARRPGRSGRRRGSPWASDRREDRWRCRGGVGGDRGSARGGVRRSVGGDVRDGVRLGRADPVEEPRRVTEVGALGRDLLEQRLGRAGRAGPDRDPRGVVERLQPRIGRGGRRWGACEGEGLVGARAEQDGGAPLGGLVGDRHGLADLAHGRIDAEALGEEPVELVAEDEGGPVGDLRLHGHHGRQPLSDERLPHAGEGVASGGAGTLAGVEHRQLHVASVVQQRPEPVARDAVAAAVVLLEDEHALLRIVVETAVADEVEDVVVVEQRALESSEGCGVEHRHGQLAAGDHVGGRGEQQLLLALDGQLGHVRGAGDHDEDP